MSKESFFSFLSHAAKDERLQAQLKTTSTQDELVDIGKKTGYEFTSSHVEEGMTELLQKPGFVGSIVEAVLELFSPDHDDYPATGAQPFSGEPNSKR